MPDPDNFLNVMSDANKPTILIVDDTADNLGVLANLLSGFGYGIRAATDGAKALKSVRLSLPDLILLDVKMPGMDGYEVCKQLKADRATAAVPIIFISALGEVVDKVKAFEVGGADYITKPFQAAEVVARVRTHLRLAQQQVQLKREVEAKQKARDALKVFIHAVSHDLRNPVTGMKYSLESLLQQARDDSEGRVSLDLQTLELFNEGCDRILRLTDDLVRSQQSQPKLMWGESLSLQSVSLYELGQRLLQSWVRRYEECNAKLTFDIPPRVPNVMADPQQLSRVFDNLLSNALKYNPPGVNAIVAATDDVGERDFVGITVSDDGVGIENSERLFALGRRGENVAVPGEGLGLYICQQIVKAHGGTMGVESKLGVGSKFWFTLSKA